MTEPVPEEVMQGVIELYERLHPPAKDGPKKPAEGKDGRWVKLGSVGVDSATLAITDPAFAPTNHVPFFENTTTRRSENPDLAKDFGSGLYFMAGFGDGTYEVWAWVVDYGRWHESDSVRVPGERKAEWVSDERIAQVVVTLVGAEDLADWRSHD